MERKDTAGSTGSSLSSLGRQLKALRTDSRASSKKDEAIYIYGEESLPNTQKDDDMMDCSQNSQQNIKGWKDEYDPKEDGSGDDDNEPVPIFGKSGVVGFDGAPAVAVSPNKRGRPRKEREERAGGASKKRRDCDEDGWQV